MNLLHPTSPRANRAINITTIAVLALANVAIIVLFSYLVISSEYSKQIERIYYFLLGSLIIGVASSFFKPRLGGLILMISIIVFSFYFSINFFTVEVPTVAY